MAKNKRELQAELEAANKRIAELSQSNQNANSNINNNEPPYSVIHKAFAIKRKKMYFLSLVFVNFLVMLLFLVIILLQLWKVINIVCINTTNFK